MSFTSSCSMAAHHQYVQRSPDVSFLMFFHFCCLFIMNERRSLSLPPLSIIVKYFRWLNLKQYIPYNNNRHAIFPLQIVSNILLLFRNNFFFSIAIIHKFTQFSYLLCLFSCLLFTEAFNHLFDGFIVVNGYISNEYHSFSVLR